MVIFVNFDLVERVEDLECQQLDEDVVHGLAKALQVSKETLGFATRRDVGLQRRHRGVCRLVGGLGLSSYRLAVVDVGCSLT